MKDKYKIIIVLCMVICFAAGMGLMYSLINGKTVENGMETVRHRLL